MMSSFVQSGVRKQYATAVLYMNLFTLVRQMRTCAYTLKLINYHEKKKKRETDIKS